MGISRTVADAMNNSSWIRRMFEAGAALRASGCTVYDFSLGNPDVPPPQALTDSLVEEASRTDPGIHGYMPNAGLPEVRERVAGQISTEQATNVPPSHVIMTCGAGGALNVALKTILDPGETVVVQAPYFMEYGFYAANHGGTVTIVPPTDDFGLNLEGIEAKLDAHTAAVIINSPNNPSGRVYTAEELSQLGTVLARAESRLGRDIYLVSDEPYRKLVYPPAVVPPTMPAYHNSIICTSYSKTLSIPGERIGYLAVHPDAADCAAFIDGAILCNRILGYVNAPALIQRALSRVLSETVAVETYRKRRDLLCTELLRQGYELTVPDGAFYAFPKAPGGDDIAFVQRLQTEGILTVPGSGFGAPGFFRVSYCVSEDVIRGAFPGFAGAIAEIISDI